MPRIFWERNGQKMEAEVSLAEFKDLIGDAPSASANQAPPQRASQAAPVVKMTIEGSIRDFLQACTDRARELFRMLRNHPEGIEAHSLAAHLGFSNPSQIGGLVGGGVSKRADKMGVRLGDLYYKRITHPQGVRTVTFYPGKRLLQVAVDEKPAA